MIPQLNHTEDTALVSVAVIVAGYMVYAGLKKISKSIDSFKPIGTITYLKSANSKNTAVNTLERDKI